MADNGVIGKANALAWDMPADRAFFRETIRGHDVVMGRRTFESHQGEEPIPYRLPIIVTRQERYRAKGVEVRNSLEEAYALAQTRGETELFILGGGVIYEQAIEAADRLIITEIHTEAEGDTYFPEINPAYWHETWREPHPADPDNPHAYDFVEYRSRPALAL